jgi:AcrR family transcriptional regulator
MDDGMASARETTARSNDRAVLDAARVVFAVHGPTAPVSAVAAEAGVGIGSLYRRYPSKDDLLRSLCLESLDELAGAARRALATADAWEGLSSFVHACVSLRVGVFSTVAGSFDTTAELRDAARRGHQLIDRVVRRAHREGVLRPDVTSVDLHVLLQVFARRPPDDGGAHQRILGLVLDGMAAGGPATALPAKPRSWHDLLADWRRSPAGDRGRRPA